ncbi:TonB-dependent receptor domain-containing protein [Campylobacter majalis]|uniref:TonB-dependent receptor domain-containing protein n=1 Tax=Campylobacter majalis TaxID=2790656 RepID=UPI003D68DF38
MRNFIYLSFIATMALAYENIADPNAINPIKSFNPPPPITPNNTLSTMPINQFDKTDRSKYYFVTEKLDDSSDKFHLSSGLYGHSSYTSALFRYRGDNYYTVLNTHYTKANDYKGGDSKKVGFGYKRNGQSLIFGYLPNEISEIKLTYIHDNITDEKQPHHQMDALKTQRHVGRVNVRVGDENIDNTLNFNTTIRHVKRRADNFTLRSMPNKTYVDIKRSIFDSGFDYDISINELHNQFGFAFSIDKHTGKRYQGMPNGMWAHNGNRFANIHAKTYKIHDTITYNIDEINALSLGLNYETNRVKIKNLHQSFIAQNANLNTNAKLYKAIYAQDTKDKINQDGLSASLKYELKPNSKDSYTIALQSLYRMPDNMQRFNALYGLGDNGWISNPYIKPERHNRIKLALEIASKMYNSYLNSMQGENSFKILAHLIYDEAHDLIIYDRRHAKPNPPINSNAVITRNIDARLFLANLQTEYNFAKNFATKIGLSYNYGENKTDNKPLYQIRPFELNTQLDYRDYFALGSYNMGANLRYVHKQTRGDFDKNTGFGIDKTQAAKGFATLDLYTGVEFKNNFGIRAGVNNVFDKNYSEFISGEHVAALDPNVIKAPGRNFYISFHMSY